MNDIKASGAQAVTARPGQTATGGVITDLVSRISGTFSAVAGAHGDTVLGVVVVAVLVGLFAPIPAIVLDFGLAVSFTTSLLVLLVAVYVHKGLEFSSFPTVLILTTMIRLTLNVSSTKLILSEGHTGPHAAGSVIEAFAEFVMGGQVIIGVVMFLILLFVNFVVITKGATRIAEVAARFTLDAMPGKQHAINEDKAAGVIDDNEVRRRRLELEQEVSFMGAMDGAAKYVKNDAVAGLVITGINLLGGITAGLISHGMSFTDAAFVYGLLTVGDGLITQIPALFISVGAGLLVAKSGTGMRPDKEIFGQVGHPRALSLGAAVLFGFAVMPGLPFVPFATCSIIVGALSYALRLSRAAQAAAAQAGKEQEAMKAAAAPAGQEREIHKLSIELEPVLAAALYGRKPPGQENVPEKDQVCVLQSAILEIRKRQEERYGVPLPDVFLRPNPMFKPGEYAILVRGSVAGRSLVRHEKILVVDRIGMGKGFGQIQGEDVLEPTLNLPARWVDSIHARAAREAGLIVATPEKAIVTHLLELVRQHVSELLDYPEMMKLVDKLSRDHRALFDEFCPKPLGRAVFQRILSNLLSEGVAVTDLPLIVEAISEGVVWSTNPETLTAHVRRRLSWQICSAVADREGRINCISLNQQTDQMLNRSVKEVDGDARVLISPENTRALTESIDQVVGNCTSEPVLIVGAMHRRWIRDILFRSAAAGKMQNAQRVLRMPVLSTEEIHPKAKLRYVGQV
ncbi:flagellar biosynthesis protein FlhA [Azospirillum sp. SYSU D00513]|uniref:flagellar biosynthesis protein FlhA n=1 Tax=Azospirillum sp. SYSU D00513 TaxID=2812561 RepID=UPI001A961240|nr:flagellar biosynthesis protein FlhA [Azospirillum sp. SYSU D00513]